MSLWRLALLAVHGFQTVTTLFPNRLNCDRWKLQNRTGSSLSIVVLTYWHIRWMLEMQRASTNSIRLPILMKKVLRETQTLRAGCIVRQSQIFSPRRRPLPGGAGRPKFNQLEMVTIYLYLQAHFGEDRCTQFRVIVVTDPPTNTHTRKQTGPITIHCAAASAQCNYTPTLRR